MLLNFYNSFRPDKTIDHPVLGEITCSGYSEAFKKCQEVMAKASHYSIQCYNLHEISMNCYRSESDEEFLNWINKKFDERKRLNDFLKENGSIQPRLQSRNMFYDVFITNIDGKKPQTDEQNTEQIKTYFQEQMNNNRDFFGDQVGREDEE